MRYYLLRTAVEEIFPLARVPVREKLLEVMERVGPYFTSMRIWSLFLEEPTITFSLFAVFVLNLTVGDYVQEVKKLVERGLGQSSREGQYFSVSLSDAADLLHGNSIFAKPLFGGAQSELSASNLHPTSRYRLGRFLGALPQSNK